MVISMTTESKMIDKINTKNPVKICGRKSNFAKMNLPFTPPKLLNIHQSGSGKSENNNEKLSRQNGAKNNFKAKWLMPFLLAIFCPKLNKIRQKKNAERPIN